MYMDDSTRRRIEENLFFQRYRDLGVKENLLSDTLDGVGHLQQQIVRLAYPEFIGRKIINTDTTKESSERFPLAGKAVGYTYGEGVACRLSGDKTRSIIINMDNYAECSEQWTKEFIEDASPNAIEHIKLRMANALALDETEAVLNLYGSIKDKDLARNVSTLAFIIQEDAMTINCLLLPWRVTPVRMLRRRHVARCLCMISL